MSSRRLVPAVLALLLALASCGLGNDEKKGDSEKPTDQPSPTTSATIGGVGDGDDEMTPWGTHLSYGESAHFEWSPKADARGSLELSVDTVERATIKEFAGFKLDESLLESTPYYVRVSVTNAGNTDLGGAEVPLFLDNGTDVLFPPANITSAFKPCPNRLLPDEFPAAATAELCLVFLAGEGTSLRAVALQTAEGSDQIEWTGELTKPGKQKPGKKKGKGNKSGKGKKDAQTDS